MHCSCVQGRLFILHCTDTGTVPPPRRGLAAEVGDVDRKSVREPIAMKESGTSGRSKAVELMLQRR